MISDQQEIKRLLQNTLPGFKSFYKMRPHNRILEAPSELKNSIKLSSVLVLLFKDHDQLKCCLIKRTKKMRYHAGQIAFPGGKIEQNETAEETALRETYEEIGISSESIDILGRLTPFYINVSKFQIIPVVGWLNQNPVFKINTDEVEKTILFSFNEYNSSVSTTEIQNMEGGKTVPCLKYNNEIIWGATAMILSEFHDLITSYKMTK
jgi:8-oxo-dGTP pyrophosphatase MutT (NUDIX family)